MQSWATFIARFRRIRGLTQKQAAAMLRVSQATLSRWETGKQVPTIAERRRIQQAVDAVTGEARRTLLALVRRSPTAVALFDERLNLLAFSDPLLRLVGLDDPAAATQSLCEWFLGEDRALLEKALARSAEGFEPVAIDRLAVRITADGSRLHLRQFWVPFVCGLGDILVRVEVGPLSSEEHERRLAGSGRVTLLSRRDLLATGDPTLGGLAVYG